LLFKDPIALATLRKINHAQKRATRQIQKWPLKSASPHSLKEQIRNQGHSIDVAVVTTGQGFATAQHAPPIEYFLLYHILSY